MKSLTDSEIQQLTKRIVKYCIIPDLDRIFTYPSFENFEQAADGLDNSVDLIKSWLDPDNTCIDMQIYQIYDNIKESITEGLDGFN